MYRWVLINIIMPFIIVVIIGCWFIYSVIIMFSVILNYMSTLSIIINMYRLCLIIVIIDITDKPINII